MAKFINISKHQGNLAKGQIKKFNFEKGCKNQFRFNQNCVESENGYSLVWKHISNDYFKLISKGIERTC